MLAYIMKTLNDRYDYGLKLVLLSIDEGITGKPDMGDMGKALNCV